MTAYLTVFSKSGGILTGADTVPFKSMADAMRHVAETYITVGYSDTITEKNGHTHTLNWRAVVGKRGEIERLWFDLPNYEKDGLGYMATVLNRDFSAICIDNQRIADDHYSDARMEGNQPTRPVPLETV
jgi:hypothetical protein